MSQRTLAPSNRRQSNRLDTHHGTHFVIIADVTGYTDRSDYISVVGRNKYAPRRRNHSALTHSRKRTIKYRKRRCAFRNFPGTEAKTESSPCLAVGNIKTKETRPILSLERYQISTHVKYSNRKRSKRLPPTLCKCGINDRVCLRQLK